MTDFNLDEPYEIPIQNDLISYDADGNEVKTFRKESFTLGQLYQLKNSAASTLATVQSRIDVVEQAQLKKIAQAGQAAQAALDTKTPALK